jgi:hypothetical protein
VEDAVGNSIESKRPKDTLTVEFPDKITGRTFKQQEGIPVEGLIDFLQTISDDQPENSEAKKQIEEQIKILKANSKSYAKSHVLTDFDVKGSDPVKTGRNGDKYRKLHERKDLEALYTSKDHRAAGSENGDQARMEKNWETSEDTLANRLELIIPPEKAEETKKEEEKDNEDKDKDKEKDKEEEDKKDDEIKVREAVVASREKDIYAKARELASKLVQKEMDAGAGYNPLNWGRKIGLYLLRPYWEQRLTQEIVKQTEEKHNAYSTIDLKNSVIRFPDLFKGKTAKLIVDTEANRALEQESAQAKIQNIKERFNEGLTESGREVSEEHKADVFEAKGEVKKALEEKILKRIIKGEITDEASLQTALAAFVTENRTKDEFKEFMQLFGSDANQFKRLTQYFASDLLQVGLDIKADLGEITDEKLATIDQRVRILLANPTKWGAESQAYFGVVDRFVARIGSHRPGALLNAGTVGAAFAIGAAVATRGSTALQLAGLTVPGIGAIFGGAAAYARKRQEFSANRQVYNLESAYNEAPVDEKMEKRAEIFKKSNYETKSSTDLLDALQKSKEKPETEIQDAIIDAIADISSRMYFNDELKAGKKPTVDLITFENRTNVEQARATLDHEMIVARRALRETIEAAGGDTMSEADAKIQAQNLINAAIEIKRRAIQEDYDKKNAQFTKDARTEALRHAATVAAFGFSGGLLSQEGLALAARTIPGITEVPVIGSWLFKRGQTTLEKGINMGVSALGYPEIGLENNTINTFQEMFQKGGTVNMGRFTIEANPTNHTMSFFDRATHKLIPGMPEAHLEAGGKIIVSGNLNNLPPEMKNWVSTETLEHSLKQQIQEAVKSGEIKNIAVGNTRMQIEGDKVWILRTDQYDALGHLKPGEKILGGTISTDGTLHFTGETTESITKIKTELAANGFQTPTENIPETGSVGVKEHFEKLGMIEKANRGEFLNNGTLISDRNELGLHLISKPDGTIIVDASTMTPQTTLPASVNKDIITNPNGTTFKNMFAFFTLDNAQDAAREGIRVPIDSNGQLILAPGTDLNQFYKPDGHGGVTQHLRFTEIFHFNEATGKYDILATFDGPEATNIGPETGTGISSDSHTLDITPPDSRILTPPTSEASPIPTIYSDWGRPIVMAEKGGIPAQEGTTTQEETPEQKQLREQIEEKRREYNDLTGNGENIAPGDVKKALELEEEIDRLEEALKATNPTPAAAQPIAVKVEDTDIISDAEIAATEAWAATTPLGHNILTKTPEEKKEFYTQVAERVKRENQLLKDRYSGDLPTPTPIGQEGVYWKKQANTANVLTCQIASAGNALRAFGIYDETRHNEQALINSMGSADFAALNANGVSDSDIIRALADRTPEVTARRSNSVEEVLQSVENGAGAIVHLSQNHIGLIPPGNRVRKTGDQLEVQVIDPLTGPRWINVDTLIKSDITVASEPNFAPVVIIERKTTTTTRQPTAEQLRNARSAVPSGRYDKSEEQLQSRTILNLTPETLRARQEVFEKAGERSLEEVQKLIEAVEQIQQEQWKDGNGRLGPTIAEIRQAQEASGVKEAIYDGGIVYLPNEKGQLVVVGDIHGDLTSTRQIIEKAKFLENMEQGDRTSTLVFLGDVVDRGQHDVEVMEVLLELKRRYPNNVVLMKADHEVITNVSDHNFPQKVYNHYYKQGYPENDPVKLNALVEEGYRGMRELDAVVAKGAINKSKLVEFLTKFALREGEYKTKHQQILNELIASMDPADQQTVRASINGAWEYLTENTPLAKDYFFGKIFNSLPRMVVCGNGVVLAHGGPSGRNLDLAGHRRQWDLLDNAMPWADPTTHVQSLWENPSSGYQAAMAEVNSLIIQATHSPDKRVEYGNQKWHVDNLKKVRDRFMQARNSGVWFNTDRTSGGILDAAWSNLLWYSEESLDNFLKQIGGTVMIRGHQTSTEVVGHKPNPFSKNSLWTIHSTGTGSDESAYRGRERNPSVAVFNKNEAITTIDPSKNIVNIWTGNMPTP